MTIDEPSDRWIMPAPLRPMCGHEPLHMGDRVFDNGRASVLDFWRWALGRAKPRTTVIGDAEGVLQLYWLLLTAVLAWVRPRHDLVLENLLLRHQLAVLTRPTRTRPRARLHTWDKRLWILARRCCARWREHLALVTPDTVVRWHRQGWRVFWRWKSRSRGGRPQLSPT